MTLIPIELDELLQVREQLVRTWLITLTENERKFLLSVKQGEPDYSLMSFDPLEQLPALQWKVLNVRKIGKEKRRDMFNKLRAMLVV